ncbi:MAG: hypothetical protein JNJ60_08755 [Rhodocyclaceae bacterium]|nr:hypothetical protein [Rhodocyclaceae bacterium]
MTMLSSRPKMGGAGHGWHPYGSGLVHAPRRSGRQALPCASRPHGANERSIYHRQ